MASKKLPQNIDLASNLEVAAGFFQTHQIQLLIKKEMHHHQKSQKQEKIPADVPLKQDSKMNNLL